MLLTDLPYLEPVLFHLRNDESLKNHFTETSFFMPHNDLVKAILDSSKNPDCVLPRSLWILPQDTTANSAPPGCKAKGTHSFSIALAVGCNRNQFILRKVDGNLELAGSFMELVKLRRLVKESMLSFVRKNTMNPSFTELVWAGDRMLYPDSDENNLIATTIDYTIKI